MPHSTVVSHVGIIADYVIEGGEKERGVYHNRWIIAQSSGITTTVTPCVARLIALSTAKAEFPTPRG